MYTVSKEVHFCYGHRLLHYPGKCKHLHGHNARAVVTLASEQLDALGMVCDFSEIDRFVGTWVEAAIDHNMLLHKDDPFLPIMQQAGERVYVMDRNPTAENIARLIYERIAEAGYPIVDVTLYETDGARASYRRS